MDVSERYEQLIAYLNSNLPAPVEQTESEAGVRQFRELHPQAVEHLQPAIDRVDRFVGHGMLLVG